MLPALFLATLFAGPVAAIALAPGGAPGDPVLVVAWRAQDVVARAGGRPLGPASAPLAIMAEGGDGFTARLDAAGAWAVLDAGWLAALCAVEKD